MRFSTRRWLARPSTLAGLAFAALLVPSAARAQYSAPSMGDSAVGEKYHIEISGSFWNPELIGVVSSEQFGIAGTNIDLQTDLGYVQTRFKDLKLVLRPSRKTKIRLQYTPMEYTAETSFKRVITFNGLNFPVSVPIESTLDWKVARLGFEYDFLYRSRGFMGFIMEGRYTRMDAQLKTNSPIFSPALNEFASAKAPLPAFGLVGRGYVLPNVAINAEFTGLKLPNSPPPAGSTQNPKYQASYWDVDINGTVNITNNLGVHVGWRKMTNYLKVDKDKGDLQFQGLYFGATARF